MTEEVEEEEEEEEVEEEWRIKQQEKQNGQKWVRRLIGPSPLFPVSVASFQWGQVQVQVVREVLLST